MPRQNNLPKPTHKVSFYGVRCWFNCDTGHLWGTNRFNQALIGTAARFHNCMSAITAFFLPGWQQPGFPFKVLEIIRDD